MKLGQAVWVSAINLISKRLINGAKHLPCIALLVLLVAALKIHLEEQALEVGTKPSS